VMTGISIPANDKIHGTSVAMNIEKSHYLMKCTVLICLFTLVLCGHSLAQGTPASAHAANCSPALLDIDGNKIWMNEEGKGNITVVFEAGFGNDSSVWSQITPKIQAAGVQTFVYDRAGMGKSTINTSTPYSIDNDVLTLRSALANCHIKGPIVMVGHSYGGAISLLAASEDPDIAGLVLIEAVVPNVWTPTEVENNLKMMRPQYDEIREKAPDLAKVAIPWAEAMPDTAKKVNALRVSDVLPIIDIEAEKGQNTPESTQTWREAHKQFTSGNPHREFVMAMGSSHKVMADQPDLVVKSILKMIETVRGKQTGAK
jgi:pimeloyl-ACP methyl ester carboxylesterase